MNSSPTNTEDTSKYLFPQTVSCYGESISSQRYILTQMIKKIGKDAPVFYMSPSEPEQFLTFVSDIDESLLSNITVHTAGSMAEQQQVIDRLRIGYENISGIIVDPFTTHYRLNRTAIVNGFRPDGIDQDTTESQAISQLERQVLTQTQQLYLIAHRRDIPLIVTNEAYYHTEEERVCPLGGELANRWFDAQYEIVADSHAKNIRVEDTRTDDHESISVPKKYHSMIGEL